MVAIVPISIINLIMSPAFTDIACAKSPTRMLSPICTSRTIGLVGRAKPCSSDNAVEILPILRNGLRRVFLPRPVGTCSLTRPPLAPADAPFLFFLGFLRGSAPALSRGSRATVAFGSVIFSARRGSAAVVGSRFASAAGGAAVSGDLARDDGSAAADSWRAANSARRLISRSARLAASLAVLISSSVRLMKVRFFLVSTCTVRAAPVLEVCLI